MKNASVVVVFFFIVSLLNLGIGCADVEPIYRNYTSTNVLLIDVYKEKLQDVVDYINSHFKTNIEVDEEVGAELVNIRCEAQWLDIVRHICANNNLELINVENGWVLRRIN